MHIEKIDENIYTSKDYSMTVKKAGIYSLLIILPVYALYIVIYLLRWNYANIFVTVFKFTFLLELFILTAVVILVQIVALIIKGWLLSFFSEGKSGKLKFKLLAENQKPYVTINEPLTVTQYRLCQFVYVLCLAVIPYVISAAIGDFMFVVMSFICVLISGGDIMLLLTLFKHNGKSYIIDYDGLFLYKIYSKK